MITLTPEGYFDVDELYGALWFTALSHRPGELVRLSAELDELLTHVLMRFQPSERA